MDDCVPEGIGEHVINFNEDAFLEAMKAGVQEALEGAGPASRLGEQE